MPSSNVVPQLYGQWAHNLLLLRWLYKRESYEILKACRPSPDATKESKIESWDLLWSLMEEDPDQWLPKDTTAWCFRHELKCPVFARIGDIQPTTTTWVHRLVETENLLEDDYAMQAVNDHLLERASQPAVVALGPNSSRKEINFLSACTSCIDFVGYGGKEAEAGSQMESFLVCMLDIHQSNPLVAFHELAGTRKNISVELYKKK